MKTPSLMLFFAVAVGAMTLVSLADAFGCKPDEVKGWIVACDSVTGETQAKCNNRQCHNALHRLVEEETIECYVSSGLGQANDLVIYQEIDAFCHGEGPDPGPKTLPPFTPLPVPSTVPVVTPSPAPTSAVPGPIPEPEPITPGPAC